MLRMEYTAEIHSTGGPGLFIFGRAEESGERLLTEYRGKVQLIYLDPPFGTGDAFEISRGTKGKKIKVPAYSDKMSDDAYMEMMKNVLELCRELMTSDGTLYLHVDYRMAAYLRVLLDEVFGKKNFVNEIIWAYKSGGRATKHFSRKHDNILVYRKGRSNYFNIEAVGIPRGPERRNHMKRHIDDTGRIYYSIRSGGKLYKYYEDSLIYPSDVWTDIEHLQQRDTGTHGLQHSETRGAAQTYNTVFIKRRGHSRRPFFGQRNHGGRSPEAGTQMDSCGSFSSSAYDPAKKAS